VWSLLFDCFLDVDKDIVVFGYVYKQTRLPFSLPQVHLDEPSTVLHLLDVSETVLSSIRYVHANAIWFQLTCL